MAKMGRSREHPLGIVGALIREHAWPHLRGWLMSLMAGYILAWLVGWPVLKPVGERVDWQQISSMMVRSEGHVMVANQPS